MCVRMCIFILCGVCLCVDDDEVMRERMIMGRETVDVCVCVCLCVCCVVCVVC